MDLSLIWVLLEFVLILKTWAIDVVNIIMKIETWCLRAGRYFMTDLEYDLIAVFQLLSCDDITFIIHIDVINSLDDSVHKSALTTTCGTNSHNHFLAVHYLTLLGVLLNVPKPPYKS
jgi:hypothetical protein